MYFCDQLKNNLDELQEFQLLEDEMSKYKTLNHENISWDKVYQYSQFILLNHSLDFKICNYFLLSCFNLNNEECFEKLLLLFQHLKKLIDENNAYILAQKRKIQNFIQNFIQEYNKTKVLISSEIVNQFITLFSEFKNLLSCNFAKIEIAQVAPQLPKSPVTQVSVNIRSDNINSLNEREYKNFYQKLAFELLEEDENNLNIYALFTQAMWGKIRCLPECNNEKITKIRKPDADIIRILLSDKENDIEHIKCFMHELILNPFWIEGVQLFCDFLEKKKKNKQLDILIILTSDFISKFDTIELLRFQNGDFICKEEVYKYFVKSKENKKSFFSSKKTDKEHTLQDFEQMLMNIDKENFNNSIMNNINSLLDMVKIFESKGMKKNSKILNIYLVELMEKTLLKDYLAEEYENAKSKIK
ncbi:type VI secretion system domain-containing protein [Campylobacter jejuni]|uniref:type VI secretion system domain-containing protein n=1 Tax=Campylobacter jejuni TaxID=197 RepID=UPI00126B6224|nr:type VI secretion system domain-containing protein [Campylobacter jejuni]EAL1777608.1 nucleobase:cation symporter [Campylobacter jejuni]EGP9841975.1 nucleobase:cation symporter [Campylobacter jejuni]EKA0286077.1 type VI secretion system domain-containing protein [Campylobacter jejuni]MCC3146657.1 type VI secretion system domain-containing protein [Campylobacter jejuni]MCG4126562.1 type VI secretion system domain-containing protein [Campylobacter jejuni]